MTFAELKAYIHLVVTDVSLQPYFGDWINNAIYEIANDFPLPALKLKEPESLAVTIAGGWLYDLPATYMKNLYKCADSDYNKVTIHRSLDDIDSLDIDHDQEGTLVSDVAVRDTQIGVYPLADDTLYLWYYELPTTLTDDADVCTCIPKQYHKRVIVPKVVIENFELLSDMSVNLPHKSLEWWKNKYREGLYGDNHGDIGMINCFARDKKPKRTGGRCPLP